MTHVHRGRIMALLEAIHDPDATQAILTCLHCPAWRISNSGRLALLRASIHDDTRLLRAMSDGGIDDLDEADRQKAHIVAADLHELQAMALRADVRDVFERRAPRRRLGTLRRS